MKCNIMNFVTNEEVEEEKVEQRHPMVWPDDQGCEDDRSQLACRAFAAQSEPVWVPAQPAACVLFPVCMLIALAPILLCLATASW